jgi:hypothetical protein
MHGEQNIKKLSYTFEQNILMLILITPQDASGWTICTAPGTRKICHRVALMVGEPMTAPVAKQRG